MAQRLAIGVTPGTGWRTDEMRLIAREAEAAGFEAIFAGEVNIDALAAAQLMGEATTTVKVGTWVANIYLRHSYLCAKHAALIADATGGRMVLGLGVSHQPVNKALGIDMPSPIDDLRRYTTEVAGWLRLSSLPARWRTGSCLSFGLLSGSPVARPGWTAVVPRPRDEGSRK
jgi:alkanesulfonate monooxygenase SsuD/methylene tetrahydromethanopterin reductase-like flavin-dependent oxidoreductase (luciferase family)